MLATGNWQLATGNWQLATGNWQLNKRTASYSLLSHDSHHTIDNAAPKISIIGKVAAPGLLIFGHYHA